MTLDNVLYVPLDERPVNLSDVVELADIADIHIMTPPQESLGKFLNKGNQEAIKEWIEKVHGDTLIVSLDMLCYGGLIASRTLHTSEEDASGYLHVLRTFKKNNPHAKIYASSIVMRLSISVSDKESAIWGESIIKYNALRYKIDILGEVGYEEECNNLERKIPEALLQQYLEARERNHFINKEAIKLVKENIIDFLILAQEDCNPYGLHVIEHQILEAEVQIAGVEDKVYIYPGADEIGQMLLVRYINDKHSYRPKVYVAYDSPEGASYIAEFEDRPIGINVDEHLKSAGIQKVDTLEQGDFILAIGTPHSPAIHMGGSPELYNKKEITQVFVKQIQGYVEKGYQVAIADLAYANGSDIYLVDSLNQNDLLFKLIGYSAWNTAGNALGTAILQGNLCYYLYQQKCISREKARKTMNFLLKRYIDDYIYQAIIRTEVNKVLRQQGVNMYNLSHEDMVIEQEIENKLNELSKLHFLGSNIKLLEFVGVLSEISIKSNLPWNRTFEIACEVKYEGGF